MTGRWLWPLGTFLAAMVGGVVGAAVAAHTLVAAEARRDSMLYSYFSTALAKGDVQTRLDTIDAAERGDAKRVIRLNCLFLRSSRAQMDVMLRGGEDADAYADRFRDVDGKIADLGARGLCGG